MKNYLELMSKVMLEGTASEDRTGTGTISLFGEQLRFDLDFVCLLTALLPLIPDNFSSTSPH